MAKVGFFENSAGERSFNRLLSAILFVYVLVMWGMESWMNKAISSLDPTVLSLLIAAMTNSGVNKWIETNANGKGEQVKFIKDVLSKVKKRGDK